MKLIALFVSVIIGLSIGTNYSKNQKFTQALLVFSAGFLFTVCVTELFPTIYIHGGETMGKWIIIGVLLQIVLEYFSKGLEHGHTHIENDTKPPFGLVFGLLIHSFIEGLPIAEGHEEIAIHNLWIAVALHKIPIAIMYAYTLNQFEIDEKVKYSLFMLFAFATPLGMYFGEMINEASILVLYAINAGIFLHISSLIIFESNKNHRFNLQKLLILLLGLACGFII